MAVLSDEELVNLLLETSYDLGIYSQKQDELERHDFKPALEARDKMKRDLLNRLVALRVGANIPEQEFVPKKIKDEPTAREVLMALIPAIWRATERNNRPSRAAAFALVCRFNQALRPLGLEYMMRPGNMIVLRRAKKRYTWADETR